MTKRDTAKREQPSIQPVTFSPHTIRRHRSRLAEWVKANGLDPNDIPLTHPIRVEEGDEGPVIRSHVYVRADSGDLQADPDQPDEVLTTERATPCTVPPPDLGAPAPQPDTEAGE